MLPSLLLTLLKVIKFHVKVVRVLLVPIYWLSIKSNWLLYVNASLEVMERDSKKMRGDKPFIFANVRSHEGVDKIINWIKSDVLLEDLK